MAVDGSAAVEAVDCFLGEAGDDLFFALGVAEGVPDVDPRGGDDAAEAGFFFDDDDAGAETGGADRGEESGARAAGKADVGFVDNGKITGGFADEGHTMMILRWN